MKYSQTQSLSLASFERNPRPDTIVRSSYNASTTHITDLEHVKPSRYYTVQLRSAWRRLTYFLTYQPSTIYITIKILLQLQTPSRIEQDRYDNPVFLECTSARTRQRLSRCSCLYLHMSVLLSSAQLSSASHTLLTPPATRSYDPDSTHSLGTYCTGTCTAPT